MVIGSRWRWLGACACVALAGAVARGGEPATTRPAPAQTGPFGPAIHEILQSVRKEQRVPALAAAVVLDDEISAAAYGQRKVFNKTLVTLDDQFHVGSCTKSMTAALCARLVERGLLRWDVTLGELYPEVRSEYRAVTLEELLCHRAGLPDDRQPDLVIFPRLRLLSGPLMHQRRAALELVLSRPPAAPPGTQYAYANAGFMIAGAICERVARQPYATLMAEQLFGPLGMRSAGFGPPGTPGRLDQPLGHRRGLLGRMNAVEVGPLADNPPCMAPAGAAHASVVDLAKYARWHLRGAGSGEAPLSAKTFARLHAPAFDQEYSYGWVMRDVGWAGGRALLHDGSNTMWYAMIIIAPQKRAAFVMVTNSGHDAAATACRQVFDALRERVLPSPARAPASAPPGR